MALHYQDISREIQGVIEEGRGEAAGFLEIGWVKEQVFNACGFIPFPGTLNLKLSTGDFDYLRQLVFARGERLIPPVSQEDFCEARVLSLDLEGVPAAMLLPMVDHYYENIVEVIAPLQLKSFLGLDNSDYLKFSPVIPPKLSLPDGIIFDLDGTLLDSVDLFYDMLCQGCRELELSVPSKEVVMEIMGSGMGLWDAWENLIENEELPEDKEAFLNRCMDIFDKIWQQRYEREVRLFEGVKELLVQLSEKGVKLGVVTSSFYPGKMDLFTRAGLDYRSIFQSIVTRKDCEHNKPHPQPIIICLQQLGLEPENCISIGDSPCDVAAVKEAGLFAVGVLSGTGTVQSLSKWGADALLDDITKLPILIEAIE